MAGRSRRAVAPWQVMRYQDACALLGVPAGASPDEVKRAFRALARELHPDRGGGPAAQERFLAVKDAYEELSGASQFTMAASAARVTEFPSGRVQREVPWEGPDVRGELAVTLQEAFEGVETYVTFTDREGCERCAATGGDPGAGLTPCPACSGGQRACRWCDGSGQVPDAACQLCLGSGLQETERTVRLAVPVSVHAGEEITLERQGMWGLHSRGDLILTVQVQAPAHMARRGDDVDVDVPVSVLQAVLGAEAVVPGPDGVRHRITITPGSGSGKRLRIRGQGMRRSEASQERGDLHAVISVQVPSPAAMTDRERQLYQMLLEEEIRKSAAPE